MLIGELGGASASAVCTPAATRCMTTASMSTPFGIFAPGGAPEQALLGMFGDGTAKDDGGVRFG